MPPYWISGRFDRNLAGEFGLSSAYFTLYPPKSQNHVKSGTMTICDNRPPDARRSFGAA
jgi:hypothetical protein